LSDTFNGGKNIIAAPDGVAFCSLERNKWLSTDWLCTDGLNISKWYYSQHISSRQRYVHTESMLCTCTLPVNRKVSSHSAVAHCKGTARLRKRPRMRTLSYVVMMSSIVLNNIFIYSV